MIDLRIRKRRFTNLNIEKNLILKNSSQMSILAAYLNSQNLRKAKRCNRKSIDEMLEKYGIKVLRAVINESGKK